LVDEAKPLVEHLGELRKRLIFCLVSVGLGMIFSYVFYDIFILDFIRGPIDALSGREDNPFVLLNPILPLIKSLSTRLENPGFTLHYIGPLEGLAVKLRLSLLCGIVMALPFVLFHIWKFISVALKTKERKIAFVYFPISLILFLAGILFAYFGMIPIGLYFLISISSELTPIITISKYASLVYMLAFVFGLAFELPLMILFLTKIGIVTPKFLAEKRKYAIFLMFVLAAFLTPPDVFTQLMLAIPVVILYEVSIWVSKIAHRKHNEQ